MAEFSLFESHIKKTVPIPTKNITVVEFIELLKQPNPKVEKIRTVLGKEEKKNLKEGLGYATFAGLFSKRGNEGLIKSSGLACLDIDGISNPEEIKRILSKDEYTHLVFISPSGEGLKLVVKIPETKNDAEYKEYYAGLTQYFPYKFDSTQDIARACFLSYDPEVYYNPNSKVFEGKGDVSKIIETPIEDKKNSRSEREFKEVIKHIRGGKTKEEIFTIMDDFAKWSSSPAGYRETSYNKALGFVEDKGLKIKGKENPEEIEKFLIIKYNKKTGEEISRKVDIDAVADHLIETHNFKTWFGTKSDYSFNWNGKAFDKDTRGIVKVECENLLKNYCKRNVVDEVFEKIKRKTKTTREEFERDDTNYINLNNGIWDIKSKKLIPHDPKYNFQHIIRITKDNNPLDIHNCPNWLKFINETLYPEDVIIMQEWFGFLLFREYFIKKAMIGVGAQDTGKSVLMDTAIMFIGEENKTGLSLQKIGGGTDFTKLSLKGKHLNAYDDLSSQDVNDGGAFKVATGGGYISGEEKFGEFQQFRSFAKIFLMGNKIPPVKDNDDLAYFGRFIPIKFDNVPDKLDPFLREKLWTEEEMSGILNWALEGLYRLLENGKFSYNKTNQETKSIMEISGCPLVAFSSEVLIKEDGEIITKDDMYKVYSLWCEKANRPRLSKEMLGRQLTKYCPYILSEKHKERIWKNAKINNEFKKILDFAKKEENTDTSDSFLKHICPEKKVSISNKNMGDIIKNKVSEEPLKNIQNCPKCNAPLIDNKCIGGCE